MGRPRKVDKEPILTSKEIDALLSGDLPPTDKEDAHNVFLNMMHSIYKKKNRDYGDSFSKSIEKWGPTAALVRMEDKFQRITKLLSGGIQQVTDESVIDTLVDLANYSIMLAMEIQKK